MNIPNIETLDNLRIVGPLTLDGSSNRAYIVPHTELILSPGEFEILYMLAMREDVPMTFEQLYNCLWEQDDDVCRREEAREAIAKVAGQINTVGNGFVWIEQHSAQGYTFKTKWAHNREKWHKPDTQ